VTRMSELLGVGLPRPPVPPLPGLYPLRSEAGRIEERWPDPGQRNDRDPEACVQQIKRRYENRDWAGCQLSLVCAAGRALFDPERRERADLAALQAFYFKEIAVTDRAPLLHTMTAAYLDSFEPGAPHTRQLASALSAARPRMRSWPKTLFTGLPELLKPETAVESLARRMVENPAPYDMLVRLGIRAPHAPGLMDHVHLCFVTRLAPAVDRQATADTLLDWLRPHGKPARRSGAAEAITALLHPWCQRNPAPDRQSTLTRRLVDMYGDPRTSRGDPWDRVARTERDVFLRWLTGETLHLLFDAITGSLTEPDEQRMWTARREFYLGLHRQRRIDAAWVAFAPDGERRARRILQASGHGTGMQFGTQTARGSRGHTSLLIARIGTKTVVDGSHNYKVHVFANSHPAAPRLFEARYDCEEIRLSRPAPRSKAHLGDWQNWVLMHV
jgi:hypothetical protein